MERTLALDGELSSYPAIQPANTRPGQARAVHACSGRTRIEAAPNLNSVMVGCSRSSHCHYGRDEFIRSTRRCSVLLALPPVRLSHDTTAAHMQHVSQYITQYSTQPALPCRPRNEADDRHKQVADLHAALYRCLACA